LLVARRWRILLAAAATAMTVAILAAPAIGGQPWRLYLEELPRLGSDPVRYVTADQTVTSLTGHLFVFDPRWSPAPAANLRPLAIGLSLTVTVVALVVSARLQRLASEERDARTLSWGLLTALCVSLTPIAESYHYLLVLPAWSLPSGGRRDAVSRGFHGRFSSSRSCCSSRHFVFTAGAPSRVAGSARPSEALRRVRLVGMAGARSLPVRIGRAPELWAARAGGFGAADTGLGGSFGPRAPRRWQSTSACARPIAGQRRGRDGRGTAPGPRTPTSSSAAHQLSPLQLPNAGRHMSGKYCRVVG
jgi:hypothetical protein